MKMGPLWFLLHFLKPNLRKYTPPHIALFSWRKTWQNPQQCNSQNDQNKTLALNLITMCLLLLTFFFYLSHNVSFIAHIYNSWRSVILKSMLTIDIKELGIKLVLGNLGRKIKIITFRFSVTNFIMFIYLYQLRDPSMYL